MVDMAPSPQALPPVKFHLVEAEEIAKGNTADASSVATAQPTKKFPKMKKGGKIQWTSLPLSSPEMNHHPNGSARKNKGHGNNHGGNGGNHNGNRMGKKWRDRKHGGNKYGKQGGAAGAGMGAYHNGFYHGMYVPMADVKVSAQTAKTQVEYYFSPDNLVQDTYLRQHMDVDGYVPIFFIAAFRGVQAVHQDYPSLVQALTESNVLEVDLPNEKVRVRDGWQKWLWPNQDGGYGVPRYVKVTEAPQVGGASVATAMNPVVSMDN